MNLFIESRLNNIKNIVQESYSQGWNDAVSSMKKQTLQEIEYIDLGLSSGTLWAKLNNWLNLAEAVRYNLPSKEEIEELFKECRFVQLPTESIQGKTLWEVQIVGPNGNRIKGFSYFLGEYSSNYHDQRIWIKDSAVDEKFETEMARVLTAYKAGEFHYQKYLDIFS